MVHHYILIQFPKRQSNRFLYLDKKGKEVQFLQYCLFKKQFLKTLIFAVSKHSNIHYFRMKNNYNFNIPFTLLTILIWPSSSCV